eukprot:6172690-Pleurochrysis_carterae.AAC.2
MALAQAQKKRDVFMYVLSEGSRDSTSTSNRHKSMASVVMCKRRRHYRRSPFFFRFCACSEVGRWLDDELRCAGAATSFDSDIAKGTGFSSRGDALWLASCVPLEAAAFLAVLGALYGTCRPRCRAASKRERKRLPSREKK